MDALPEPVNTFIATVNENNTSAFISLFQPDGVVNDWGTRYVGQDKIRTWSDREFLGAKVTLNVTRVSHNGSEFSIDAIVGGSGFKGPSKFVLVLDGQKIREMRITAD